MKYRNRLLYAIVLCLSACTNIRNSTDEDIRVDGQPIGNIEDVARIQIKTHKNDPKNLLLPWWSVTIVELDGNTLPRNNKAWVLQTTPGKHRIKIAYSIEDDFNSTRNRIRSFCMLDNMQLEAGKLIFINTFSSNAPGLCSIKYGEDDPLKAYLRTH